MYAQTMEYRGIFTIVLTDYYTKNQPYSLQTRWTDVLF